MEEDDVKPSDLFKKPQAQLCLVGPRRGKGVKLRTLPQGKQTEIIKEDGSTVASSVVIATCHLEQQSIIDCKEPDEEVKSQPVALDSDGTKSKLVTSLSPSQMPKETPIPYIEPKWTGTPDEQYSLDVIKSGLIVQTLDLREKPFHVFGRQSNCDIQMAHPTVSRYHSVLQYSRGTNEKSQGFYIYDLGSTHGTFLNKNRIRQQTYVPIKVGHQLKLGCSSRLFLLQGPQFDMEEESKFTVTELKAQRQLRLQEREISKLELKQREEERESGGVDWGMGDDADEESDLSENPYAITTNEDLYVDDPKKTLRGWFEREGHELEYDIEEKGPGQFLCRVEVPVEGARGGCMTAEALVKGKKKEAVVQCALEACRLLDRLGLLRQATHESRKRKVKNWEDDDFYDSDDDNFLDRTGVVEKKRQQRMQMAGKSEKHVETFESLTEKHSAVLERLNSTQAQLEKAVADLAASKKKEAAEDDTDTLDSFMNNLVSVGCLDKTLVSKLKSELLDLQKEETHFRKLVNIARPASLPELTSPVVSAKANFEEDSSAFKNKILQHARRKACMKPKDVAEKSSRNYSLDKNTDLKCVENKGEESQHHRNDDEGRLQPHEKSDIKEGISSVKNEQSEDLEQKAIVGPAKPSFIMDALNSEVNNELDRSDVNMDDHESNEEDKAQNQREFEKRKKKNRRRAQLRTEKAVEKTKSCYDPSDPNYSMWVPPENQSGDGKTKLNEKLGY